ncbi:receptor-transporting protein 3-like [Athene cunicularia]|uniref:receptor-transporting protein 3-like n=1 Tax=Athene cunicularia TaxID=194338 RepID=UPI000EF6D56B|nr:receptor-transporting protein 3-like [Athene cunicularia]
MRIWQDIFAVKIADMHLTEPWTLQEDDTLQVHVLKPGWKEFVQPRALGRFQCSQCFRQWSSARVHILFHMCRQHQGQGMVWMRAFRQACRQCPNPRLEKPMFSQETVERLLHNLVLKILKYFYHMPVQTSDLMEVVVDALVVGPHDSARCEGCQLGVCSKSQLAPASNVCQPLTDADKARTHRTPKHKGMRPCATQTHHSSPCDNSFPWKCCCCIGSSLLCVLAVLLFVLLYFIMN